MPYRSYKNFLPVSLKEGSGKSKKIPTKSLGHCGDLCVVKQKACFQQAVVLSTQAKSLDDGTITFDVTIIKIIQQATTLTYQHSQ